MTNSSESSQCDPELAIPGIFWDMETNPPYQAIGSERQIFSMSVNKTYNQIDSGSSRITKVNSKYMKCGVLLVRCFEIGSNRVSQSNPELFIFFLLVTAIWYMYKRKSCKHFKF